MNADPLARWYRWLEYLAFGSALERSRCTYLSELRDVKSILVLGEGDGRMLQQLLVFAPSAEVDVIESSAAMVKLAKRRIGESQRVRFFCQEAGHALPGTTYEAIVTCFFLDCFAEPELLSLVTKLEIKLSAKGLWLMTDFAIPASGARRLHAKLWIAAMYLFFRLATGLRVCRLPPIETVLSQVGLVCMAQRSSRAGMITAQLWRKKENGPFLACLH